MEPFASKLKARPDELVKMYEPSDIHILVTGGETQGAFKMYGGSLRSDYAIQSIDAGR